jgi:hypothetical protein
MRLEALAEVTEADYAAARLRVSVEADTWIMRRRCWSEGAGCRTGCCRWLAWWRSSVPCGISEEAVKMRAGEEVEVKVEQWWLETVVSQRKC